MRKVDRSGTNEPEILRSDEVRRAKIALGTYLKRNAAEQEQRRPPVDERLYLHSDVVLALRSLFMDKCAYCETGLMPGAEYVDHYRPRSRALSLDGIETATAYLWLAYDWHNLLLACRVCAEAKGNLFPVADKRAHLRASDAEIAAEETPELLDPTRHDPAASLIFSTNGDVRPSDRLGDVTIAVLQLNRPELVEARSRDLQVLGRNLARLVERPRQEELLLLFAPARQHAEARLDILGQILQHCTGLGSSPPVNRREWPQWFAEWVPSLSADRKSALGNALALVFVEDSGIPRIVQTRPEDLQLERGDRRAEQAEIRTSWPERYISAVEISNFKGIDEILIRLEPHALRTETVPALMLIGENAAGKSSVVEAIALAIMGNREVQQLGIPPSEWLRRDDPDGFHLLDPKPAKVLIAFSDGGPICEFTVTADGRRVGGTAEGSALLLTYGPRRLFADQAAPFEPHRRLNGLFSASQSMPNPGPWLHSIRDTELFAPVARVLREILAIGDDDDIVIDDAHRICVRILGRPIPIEKLSDGYRALFSLSVDIMRNLLLSWDDLENARAIVLIDEIEMHLHPRWKMRIMPSLRRAFPGVQFIVTTHDPLCIRGMDDGEVEVIERDRKGGVHLVADLPSVKGMRSEQLLTSEYFGLFSTADPGLEWSLYRIGEAPEDRVDSDDEDLINDIVLGDTLKQQLIHKAVDLYLEKRERHEAPVNARHEAIEAILRVLEDTEDDVRQVPVQ